MRHGIHFVRTQYLDDLLSDEFNKQLRGIVQPGVKEGYAAKAGSTAAKVSLEPGILFTGEGDQVELESEYADVPGLDATANASVSDRLDLIYCYYRYIESSPAPQPSYGVILGTAGTFSLTGYGQNQYQIPVALGLVEAGASVYSTFYPFPRPYRINHYVLSGKEYITNGNQTAMKITIIPRTIQSLSISAGILVEMVATGTLSDDDEITSWSTPFHLTYQGETNINALLAEVTAARGSKTSLDDRLDVSLNEDGTLNFSGGLGALLAEIATARGDMSSLDARLDVSLLETGGLGVDTVRGHAGATIPPSNNIISRTINNTDIALTGIQEENLADECVTVNKIGLGAVGTNRLADYAVSNAKLGLLAVKDINLYPSAVTTNKINDLAVTTGKIDDDAVTQAKRAAKLHGRWKVSATQSISSGSPYSIAFDTQEIANLGTSAVKSDPFNFQATRDMKLHVSTHIQFQSAAWAAGDKAILRLVRVGSGSSFHILDYHEVEASSTTIIGLSGSIMIDLDLGEHFILTIWHDRGSSTNLDYDATDTLGWVSVDEV